MLSYTSLQIWMYYFCIFFEIYHKFSISFILFPLEYPVSLNFRISLNYKIWFRYVFPLFPWLGWVPTVPERCYTPNFHKGRPSRLCTCGHVCPLYVTFCPWWAAQHMIQYRAQFLWAFHSQLWPRLITGFVELIHYPGVGAYGIHDIDSVIDL